MQQLVVPEGGEGQTLRKCVDMLSDTGDVGDTDGELVEVALCVLELGVCSTPLSPSRESRRIGLFAPRSIAGLASAGGTLNGVTRCGLALSWLLPAGQRRRLHARHTGTRVGVLQNTFP